MDGTQNIAGSPAPQHRTTLDDNTRQRLQRVTKEFESLLVGYMLKSMRSGTDTNGMFGDSYGGDVLDGLFDSQMAQHVSRNSSLGLAEMLYRRITGEAMPAPATQAPPAAAGTAVKATTPKAVPAQPPPASGTQVHPGNGPVVLSSAKTAFPQTAAAADSTRAVSDTLQRRLDKVAPLIEEAADTHGVDANLLRAIIATESHGNASARSPKNAKGLMQLIDSTAAAMGVKNVWNPRDNVHGGAKYISQLLERFGGDLEKAVASYNAGPGAVLKHGGIPPFKETRAYVDKVMNYLRVFDQKESGDGDTD